MSLGELTFQHRTNPAVVPSYHDNTAAAFYVYEQDLISDILARGLVWEPHLHRVFERYITKESFVIEGGAYLGAHTVKLSKLAGAVLAFEPFIPTIQLLKRTLAYNGCMNVGLSYAALSNEIGFTSYAWVDKANYGGAGLSQNSGEGSEHYVRTTTIDAAAKSAGRLDFIKLDVEGYEQRAIAGGMEAISQCFPTIVLECWDEYPSSSLERAEKEYGNLLDLGYSVSRISEDSPDYLFVHESRGAL